MAMRLRALLLSWCLLQAHEKGTEILRVTGNHDGLVQQDRHLQQPSKEVPGETYGRNLNTPKQLLFFNPTNLNSLIYKYIK